MKKLISLVLVVAMLACGVIAFSSCSDDDTIIVHTNAYFAPFEYYKGTEIVGVDIEIMKMVGEKLDREVEFVNVDFATIIDSVSKGEVCDVGAAGLTITDERAAKVDFSIPYYTSVQYVIFKSDDTSIATRTANGVDYIVWEALAGKKVGTQTDTTGWIYADGEINAEGGVLYNSDAELKNYDSAQLAADAVKANQADVVIIDELPAQYIVSKNSGFKCLPLYYAGETAAEDAPVEEEYAICVTKGNDELLDAINEVLEDLLVVGEDGKNEIERMVMKHMGLSA